MRPMRTLPVRLGLHCSNFLSLPSFLNTMNVLLLPSCPELLPPVLQDLTLVQWPSAVQALPQPGAHWSRDLQKLQQGTQGVQHVVGGIQTPALCWVLAMQTLPAASIWHHDGQQWHCLTSASAEAVETIISSPVPAPAQASVPTPASQNLASPAGGTLAKMKDHALIREVFILSAWGDTPERERSIERLQEEASMRGSDLIRRVSAARKNGRRAHRMGEDMLAVFKSDGQTAAQEWIDKHGRVHHSSITDHLDIMLKKELKRQQNLSQRHKAQTGYRSTLQATRLHDGQHPNSLRLLPAANHWRIYIDETGKDFDDSVAELASTDWKVGRMVALAVPADVQLPALKPGFHATDETVEVVDQAVAAVLGAKVGVLGFSVQDASTRHQMWLGHVQHLLRWMLLQLPMAPTPGRGSRIDVHIEQRGHHKAGSSMDLLAETLQSEMQGLDPQRFDGVLLQLQLVNESDPMIGYVDALAFTWGSNSAPARDRLRKSALRGHCLVEADPDQATLHHLYLALSEQRTLLPAEWYALCSAAASDPEHGFLARGLAQSAQGLTTRQWSQRLAEVQQRLRAKDYRLSELALALDWLQRHAPAGQDLPPALRLALNSAQLASTNHHGRINGALVEQCLSLAQTLRDEEPQLAVEAILRLASATTNTFEFDVLQSAVQDWLQQPLAVGGLLQHAKLHSTLGQMLAFTGQAAAALPTFDRALQLLDKLSDPDQRQLERLQTAGYRHMAAMDDWLSRGAPADQEPALLEALLAHMCQGVGKNDAQAISRSLAYSGQKQRYLHHLWLRSLVSLPTLHAQAAATYLDQSQQWQQEKDHPWPLISAYRAWLLHQHGRLNEAQDHMIRAISLTADAGPILQWMAEVLRTLSQSMGLGLDNEYKASETERARLKEILPNAPHEALNKYVTDKNFSHEHCLQHLSRCLPFNFH